MIASGVILVVPAYEQATMPIVVFGGTQSTRIVVVTPEAGSAQTATTLTGTITVQSVTQTFFRDNIKKFIPREYWRMDLLDNAEGGGQGALEDMLVDVFALTLDEIKQSIDEFVTLFDVETCPPRFLPVMAGYLGFPLDELDVTSRQRQQLREAVNLYKYKGSPKSFEAILNFFGFRARVVPLWTTNYTVFWESIPGVARGSDPPNDFPLLLENGGNWYRSPHFGIYLNPITGGPIKEDLLDGCYKYFFSEDDLNDMMRKIEFIRPINAVLEWLKFKMDLGNETYTITDVDELISVNPTCTEFGFYTGYCDLDDIQYTRLDPLLLGPDYLTLTSPLAAYVPMDPIPPTDRSGVADRGSAVLSRPHLRDPQPGICHPIETLGLDIDYILDEGYELALTRDGLTYPASVAPSPGDGEYTGYIDKSSFPSRGFTNGTTVAAEIIDSSPDSATLSFSGTAASSPIAPGTFIVSATLDVEGAVTLVDDLAGGLTAAGGNHTGTVTYSTGAWTLLFVTNAPTTATDITADYSYYPAEPALPGHANTFTRANGFSDYALSILEVEVSTP